MIMTFVKYHLTAVKKSYIIMVCTLDRKVGFLVRKKLFAAITAAAVSTSLTSSVSAAEKKYSASDLKDLRNSLLGVQPVKAGQDVDENGRVDVFDMIHMRRNYAGSGEFSETVCPASEQNVKYIGRNLYDNDVMWLVQSGSAAEFKVNAKAASVTLCGDSSIHNSPDHQARYAVILDGEIIADGTMGDKTKEITLFSGEENRIADVRVIHLSEATNGAVGISGIKTLSEVAHPVIPAEKKKLNIEFIGDSITCAYGVEAANQNESFKTTTENYMKSYAYLTAEKLGADYSAVAYSGHGIVSGYTSSGEKNDTSLVPPYYENIGPGKNYSVPWDFSKVRNDVVIINLGTNDATYVEKSPDDCGAEFVKGYEEFLETVRKNNPDAYIICTIGIMGCTDMYPMIEEAIAQYKAKNSDERITSYQSPVQTQADGFGADWHPSAVTQQKNAYLLADRICQVLGLESDQVGLDVAAEAEYSVKCNEESGASAATFFSEYDRSFWINIVGGGTFDSDVQAIISGINLKKGGKYRLTFNCTSSQSSVDGNKVTVRGSGTEYYSGTFVNKGERSPFEAEFTVGSDDRNSEIVLNIGGVDYSSATLYDVRLEKIG